MSGGKKVGGRCGVGRGRRHGAGHTCWQSGHGPDRAQASAGRGGASATSYLQAGNAHNLSNAGGKQAPTLAPDPRPRPRPRPRSGHHPDPDLARRAHDHGGGLARSARRLTSATSAPLPPADARAGENPFCAHTLRQPGGGGGSPDVTRALPAAARSIPGLSLALSNARDYRQSREYRTRDVSAISCSLRSESLCTCHGSRGTCVRARGESGEGTDLSQILIRKTMEIEFERETGQDFTAAVWCVPALRVPLVHSLINHFCQNFLPTEQ